MIFAGMIGAVVGGLVLDYSKLFKEVAVVSYSLAIVSFIWFYEVSYSPVAMVLTNTTPYSHIRCSPTVGNKWT